MLTFPINLATKDRVMGCLLGGALGDAWGGPFEGRDSWSHFEIPRKPTVSDDTEFTLATCESIIEQGGVNTASVAAHLLSRFQTKRIRGIGSSTLKAMRDLAAGTHWALSGARGEFAAGNGAAMRIAPLSFLLDPALPDDRVLIRDVCRITHHNDEAYAGALAVMAAIRSVLSGEWQGGQSFLASAFKIVPDSTVRDRIAALRSLQLPVGEVAHNFGATGYVVDSVPLALYCAELIRSEPLPKVIELTIRAGGDTDTIASIAGQIAGTVVGTAGIPVQLIQCVENSGLITSLVSAFASFVENLGK